MTVLCLINQKGGCGKSGTGFHLAGALAADGRRALLVDADPQGSTTQGFFGPGLVESLPPERTLAVLFDERFGFADRSRLALRTGFEGIDVVPANHHLARHNKPEPETGGDLQYAVRELLDELPAYDAVLIDCPPNLYTCSWTAMVASDRALIPVPPEDFGTQGVRAVHRAVADARTRNPSLRRPGRLLTRADSRLLVRRSYAKELRAAYGSWCWTPPCPRRARSRSRSPAAGRWNPTSRTARRPRPRGN